MKRPFKLIKMVLNRKNSQLNQENSSLERFSKKYFYSHCKLSKKFVTFLSLIEFSSNSVP